MSESMNPEKLLADLRRLYEEQGEVPTAQDYRDKGNYPLQRIYDNFDGLTDARKKVGIDEDREKDIPHKIEKERLLKDIYGLWWHLGRVPTTDDYREMGKYTLRPIYNQFDGFVDAREQAGVYEGHLQHVSKEDLIDRLQRLYEELGREPKIYDYIERFSYDTDQFYEHGGFTALKKEAGVYEGRYGNEARQVSPEELIEDLQEKAEKVDGPLSIEKYKDMDGYSAKNVVDTFGSFVTARAEAGLRSSSLLFRTGSDHPRHTGHRRDIYKLARFRKNRPKVLERDNYECQHCGMDSDSHIKRYGRDLTAHHIYPTWLIEYPDDEIHAMPNMVTLCEECHGLYEGWFYGPDELLDLFGP